MAEQVVQKMDQLQAMRVDVSNEEAEDDDGDGVAENEGDDSVSFCCR